MKFWFDTEFYENGRTIDLISIGVVSEDGREYYAESGVADVIASQSDWLKRNVFPHLIGGGKNRPIIARELVQFMGEKPEIWAYYADYDWVALCQLFGTMMDLPKGWPMYCRDVKQFCDSLGNPKLPEQTTTEHHALADARWTKQAWDYLQKFQAPDTGQPQGQPLGPEPAPSAAAAPSIPKEPWEPWPNSYNPNNTTQLG